jgi:hypothetical protein
VAREPVLLSSDSGGGALDMVNIKHAAAQTSVLLVQGLRLGQPLSVSWFACERTGPPRSPLPPMEGRVRVREAVAWPDCNRPPNGRALRQDSLSFAGGRGNLGRGAGPRATGCAPT